jgi:hypothetical protein
MYKLSKKSVVIAAGTILFLSAGAAYAYWTNTGSGSGTAATGTNAAVTVNQTSSISGLYPGGSAQTLSGDFTNPNSGATWVTAVTATGLSVDSTHATAGCLSADYTLGGSAAVAASVPAGANQGSWTGLTIQLNNTVISQDACKGATITITYSSS